MLDFLNGNDKSIKIAVPLKKLCVKIVVCFTVYILSRGFKEAIKRKQSEATLETQPEPDEETTNNGDESLFSPEMPEVALTCTIFKLNA